MYIWIVTWPRYYTYLGIDPLFLHRLLYFSPVLDPNSLAYQRTSVPSAYVKDGHLRILTRIHKAKTQGGGLS